MRKSQRKHLIFWFFALTAFAFFHGGCGILGILGTPRHKEGKVAAECDLSNHTDRKILVLVHQPAYLNVQENLRFHLTGAINKSLVENIKFVPEQVVSYDELSRFRSNKSDFSFLSPAEVGRALEADMVLLVTVEDYQLLKMPDVDYYRGFLNAEAVLVDTAAGEKLWPESAKSKSVRVGFEIEDRGREVAVGRLTAACAHCIVRYLYNCPKNKFKITDDKSGAGWKDWGK